MSWLSAMWFIFSNVVLSHFSGTIFIFSRRTENPAGGFMRVAWSPLLSVVVDNSVWLSGFYSMENGDETGEKKNPAL